MLVPTAVLAVLTLAIGVFAGPLFELAERAAVDLVDPTRYREAVLGPVRSWGYVVALAVIWVLLWGSASPANVLSGLADRRRPRAARARTAPPLAASATCSVRSPSRDSSATCSS